MKRPSFALPAAAAATALIMTGAMALPASAASSTDYVTAGEIAPGPETNATYLGWHEGAGAGVRHEVRWDGLHLATGAGASQIINGLVPGGTPGLPTGEAGASRADYELLGHRRAGQRHPSGGVHRDDDCHPAYWGTLRPRHAAAVGHQHARRHGQWMSSRTVGNVMSRTSPNHWRHRRRAGGSRRPAPLLRIRRPGRHAFGGRADHLE